MQEPWDGPALLIFCDGKQLGAQLDRNGLRPARFLQTKDGLIGFMSETGVIEVDDEDVVRKGRLGPGNMITLDLETGVFKENVDSKLDLAQKAPYGKWLEEKRTSHPEARLRRRGEHGDALEHGGAIDGVWLVVRGHRDAARRHVERWEGDPLLAR